MRKLLILVAALIAIHVAFLFVRPSSAALPPSDKAVKVGIVLDVGGLGDKSFNDGAYHGAVRAEKELGAQIRLIEPSDGTDREAFPCSPRRRWISHRRRLHLHRRYHALAKEYPTTKLRRRRLLARHRQSGQSIPRHPTSPPQVQGGRRILPRRRARGAQLSIRRRWFHRRNGRAAHLEVRGRIQSGSESDLSPRLHG
jgi:hypothetical protein